MIKPTWNGKLGSSWKKSYGSREEAEEGGDEGIPDQDYHEDAEDEDDDEEDDELDLHPDRDGADYKYYWQLSQKRQYVCTIFNKNNRNTLI